MIPAASGPPVVCFLSGPCEEPEVRRRFVGDVRRALRSAEQLGWRAEVEEAIDAILMVPDLRPGVLVAARGGAQPLLLVTSSEAPGPLLDLSFAAAAERAA